MTLIAFSEFFGEFIRVVRCSNPPKDELLSDTLDDDETTLLRRKQLSIYCSMSVSRLRSGMCCVKSARKISLFLPPPRAISLSSFAEVGLS